MARQVGLVKYSGTMGGVRHFKIKGLNADFAGLAGGPSSEQIQNDEAFVRTRENMNEFGGCATAAKSLRVALSQIIKQYSDPRLTGRLTALFKQINLKDTANPRGQRSILISSHGQILQGLDYNENISFSGVFHAPFTITSTPARDSSTFSIPPFNPANMVSAPSGATHFRLVNAIAVLSDWYYNPTQGKYEPTDQSLSGLSDIQYSAYLDLNAPVPVTSIMATLPGSPLMTASVKVANNIGIEFYQEVGGSYYLFASGNALKLETGF